MKPAVCPLLLFYWAVVETRKHQSVVVFDPAIGMLTITREI
jgi:hypothetical protein